MATSIESAPALTVVFGLALVMALVGSLLLVAALVDRTGSTIGRPAVGSRSGFMTAPLPPAQ